MEALPQLFMRQPDITELPDLIIPDGLCIKTHTDDMADKWEALIQKAFSRRYDFNECIVNGISAEGYNPKQVLYLMDGENILATATATSHTSFPGEGWFRMIAAHPEARGRGLGKLICLAALHNLAERGYTSVVLSTDDERIPALKTYLGLGFEPVYSHESHRERWDKIFKILK